eukprot:811691-Rhodomonas_salina.4
MIAPADTAGTRVPGVPGTQGTRVPGLVLLSAQPHRNPSNPWSNLNTPRRDPALSRAEVAGGTRVPGYPPRMPDRNPWLGISTLLQSFEGGWGDPR